MFSINCVNLIKLFEGLRINPYRDATGIPTIGYGLTYYSTGARVTMSDPPVNELKASQELLWHLNKNEAPNLTKLLKVELNQNQIDALGSLIYNIGSGNFAKSSLLKGINSNLSQDKLKPLWLEWNKANGKTFDGLTRRRESEWNLYIKPL